MPIIGVVASSILKASSSFDSIATVTASGGETSLDFTSIPSTYKYLQIRGRARANAGGTSTLSIYMQFNADTGSNYVRQIFSGGGGGISDVTGADSSGINIRIFGSVMNTNANTNDSAVSLITIYDYASTAKRKSVNYFAGSNNDSTSTIYRSVAGGGVWNSTSAITSIKLEGEQPYAAGSTFSLYGIK